MAIIQLGSGISQAQLIWLVAGAIISGIIGLIHAEYRYWRDDRRDLREWYDKTISYADNIKLVDYIEDLADDESVNIEKMGQAETKFERIAPQLTSHNHNAPKEISSELRNQLEETVWACEKATTKGPEGNVYVRDEYQDVFSEANELAKLAEQERPTNLSSKILKKVKRHI